MEDGNWLFYAVAILGVAVVLLTSLIKNVGWSGKAKNVVATVLSVLGAGVFLVINPDQSVNDAGDFAALAMSAYGTSQLLYTFILSGTTVEAKLADTEVL